MRWIAGAFAAWVEDVSMLRAEREQFERQRARDVTEKQEWIREREMEKREWAKTITQKMCVMLWGGAEGSRGLLGERANEMHGGLLLTAFGAWAALSLRQRRRELLEERVNLRLELSERDRKSEKEKLAFEKERQREASALRNRDAEVERCGEEVERMMKQVIDLEQRLQQAENEVGGLVLQKEGLVQSSMKALRYHPTHKTQRFRRKRSFQSQTLTDTNTSDCTCVASLHGGRQGANGAKRHTINALALLVGHDALSRTHRRTSRARAAHL